MPAKPVPIEKRVSDLAYQLKGRADKLQHNAFHPTNELREGAAAKALDGLSEQIEKLENVNTPAEQKALVDAYAAIKTRAETQYRGWVSGTEYDAKAWTQNFEPMKELIFTKRRADIQASSTALMAHLAVALPPLPGAPVPTPAETAEHAAKDAKRQELLLKATDNELEAKRITGDVAVDLGAYIGLTPAAKEEKMQALLKSANELNTEAKNTLAAPRVGGPIPVPAQLPESKLDGLLEGINKAKDETQKAAMTELDRSLKAKNEEQHQKEIRYFRMRHLLETNSIEKMLVRAAGRPLPAGGGGVAELGNSEDIEHLEQAMKDLKSGGGGLLKVDYTGATIEYRGGSFTLPRMGNTEASKRIFVNRLYAILNVAVLNADTDPTTPPAPPAMPNITYDLASKEAVEFKELVKVMQEAAKRGVEVNLGPNVLAKINNLPANENSTLLAALPGRYPGIAFGVEQFLAFQQACNKEAAEVNQKRYEQVTKKVSALGKEREFTKIEKQLLDIAPPQILSDRDHKAAVDAHPAAMDAYNREVAARAAAAAAGRPVVGPPPAAPVAPLAVAPVAPLEGAAEEAARQAAIVKVLPEAIQKLKEQIVLIESLQNQNVDDSEIAALLTKARLLQGEIAAAMTNNAINPAPPIPPNVPPVTVTDRFHDQTGGTYPAQRDDINDRLAEIARKEATAAAVPNRPQS